MSMHKCESIKQRKLISPQLLCFATSSSQQAPSSRKLGRNWNPNSSPASLLGES